MNLSRKIVLNLMLVFFFQLILSNFASAATTQSRVPSEWSLPNTHGPLCAPEGQLCHFNGDCCQGVCKNFMVCEAPLYCVPPHFSCNTDFDCCEGSCNILSHECNARAL
jgi:hypothetical protein